MLVVGVVAAQLRTPRGRVHLHLPPRAEIQLELLQRRAVPRPLPGQFLRGGAVKRGKGSKSSHLPAAICSLSCALVAIRDPSLKHSNSVCRFVRSIVMHPFCFFNFYRRKSAKFGVRLKE